MNTVVDGGTLKVRHYATMDGITLNSGTVTILGDKTTDPVDLGDINVYGGILTLDNANIESAITMNAGKLNIIGSVKNGAISGNMNNSDISTEGGEISATIGGSSSFEATGDTTLSGNNSYTEGTSINNATLTLGHENALGKSSITTTGNAGLATADGIVAANLPGTITIEDGSLTMSGKYKADAANLNGGQTESHDTEWFDVDGEEGNGFMREGGEAYRVVDVSKGTLKVDALDDMTVDIKVDINENEYQEYQLYSDGLAGKKLDYSTYHIKGKHEVSVSEILAANDTDTATEKVVMEHAEGTLTADTDIEVQSTAGSLSVTNDAKVTGRLGNTSITAEDGEIAATIGGTSSVKATSGTTTTLSGDNNSYSGGTTIDAAELIVTKDGGLGTGDVWLQGGGTLDLSNKAISNTIYVKGCTLRGGAGYKGDLIVENPLVLEGDTTAQSVTLTNNGSLTLDAANRLTILNGGGITLSDGCVLSVAGSLTLDGNTTLSLKDTYNVGTALVTGEAGLTLGTVTLDYADSTMELEQIGNMLVLVSKFKQDKADAMAQGNWGIATASRAFVNTVRGQRNNTGCLANGKGTAWFSLLGASNNLKGGDVSVEGAAVGADMKVGKCSVMGVAFGYTDGTVSPAGLRKVEQDGYYAAVYGEHGLRKLSADSYLSLDWVAAYGTTESHQGELNWEQDSLQLNARVNWNKQLSNRLGVTAFAGVEYFANESDTAEGAKSGSIQNLRGELGVGVSYVAWGAPDTEPVTDEKGGLVSAGTAGCRKLVLHGELRYFNDLVRSNPVVEMAGIRGMGTNPGRQGFGVEAGATYRINDRWTTSANYGFNAMEDSQEHRVNVGASYTF
ncbi:MAG: autotransporter domain-containing protein [Akkermansia sp.]|nr:autotransporter domain-containing protein [Akkermansia sp.]